MKRRDKRFSSFRWRETINDNTEITTDSVVGQ